MPKTVPSRAGSNCTPKTRVNKTLSLPVLANGNGSHHNRNAWDSGHATIAHSKVGKWRAASLILVHVLIAAHIIQWLVVGMTVSPVEPSESMQAARNGIINAGFIFFVLAILSTAILGRFFCGWACHIVALQDLCSWLMSRVGVKPKPFRSRLLLWFPLGLALYMFVWPIVHREVLRPLLADARGRMPAWLGQSEPLPGLTSEFLVQDFWATFAPWQVAIPFIFICTFGAVYFLGSKGFCTYGCPYGGFFAPADLIAPGKIRVTDACEHCGHCTAVCTSNVRVHEEVRDFGMVVDPGCMKCMDCISVCPNDALYFGLGTPTVLAKPREGREESAAAATAMREARFDLTKREEWVIAALFLVLFMGYRGMYNTIPMLMAAGMAGIVAFSAWKCWRMLRDPNARLQSLQLKFKGRVRPIGWAFMLGTVVMLVVAAWSACVRYRLWDAEMNYARLETPISVVMRPDFEPTADESARAERALMDYAAAGPPSQGGFGWPHRADDLANIAYMQLLLGRRADAEKTLRRIIDEGRPTDALIQQIAAIMGARGAPPEESLAMLRSALSKHPDLDQTRDQLARDMLRKQNRASAVTLWEEGLKVRKWSARAKLAAAGFFRDAQDKPRAEKLLAEAVEQGKHESDVLIGAAGVAASLNGRDRAVKLASDAAEAARGNAAQRIGAAGILSQLGDSEKALMQALRGVERSRQRGRHSGQPDLFLRAAFINLSAGKMEQGMMLANEASATASGSPWDMAALGVTLANIGTQAGNKPMVDMGIKLLQQARDAEPDAPTIRHDLAVAYGFRSQTTDDKAAADADANAAAIEMERAAQLAKSSDLIASRYADLLRELGRTEDADKWAREAERRKQAKGKP